MHWPSTEEMKAAAIWMGVALVIVQSAVTIVNQIAVCLRGLGLL